MAVTPFFAVEVLEMDHPFSPEVNHLVQQQMATGNYRSEEEVLLEALKSLARRDIEVAAIQAGIDNMEAGRLRTLDQADQALRLKHGFSEDA